ncbi:hypothetical protein [Bacillus sp. AK031]
MEAANQEIRLKRKNAYIFRVTVKLAAEALMLLAILTFFFDKLFFLSACLPFIALSFLLTAPLVWMGIDSSRLFNMIFLGEGLILFLIGQFILGIPWWFSLAALFLLHWRVSTHLEEEREILFEISSGFVLGFMLISISSFAYQGIYHMQPSGIILMVFIAGMFVYAGGTFVVRLVESAEHSKRSTRTDSVKLPLIFFSGIIALTAIFGLLNSTVSNVLASVFKGFFFILSFLIDPIWRIIQWFLGLLPGNMPEDIDILRRSDEEPIYEMTQEQLENGGELSFAWWNEAIIGLLALIILIYMWRRYKEKGWKEEGKEKKYAGFSSYRESVLPGKKKQKDIEEYSTANCEIRKSIYSLEQHAAKQDMGRIKGETLQEWFLRLGFKEDNEFYRLYEEVRYGNKEVPPEKVQWFTQSVECLEEKMKSSLSQKNSQDL